MSTRTLKVVRYFWIGFPRNHEIWSPRRPATGTARSASSRSASGIDLPPNPRLETSRRKVFCLAFLARATLASFRSVHTSGIPGINGFSVAGPEYQRYLARSTGPTSFKPVQRDRVSQLLLPQSSFRAAFPRSGPTSAEKAGPLWSLPSGPTLAERLARLRCILHAATWQS